MDLVSVQGLVVRLGEVNDYIVLWCKKFNHCYVYSRDICKNIFMEADAGEWFGFDVNPNREPGPEGIWMRAYHIYRVSSHESENPATTPDEEYSDIHSLKNFKLFSSIEKTLRFKSHFWILPNYQENELDVEGDKLIFEYYLKVVRIEFRDYKQLQKYGISDFDGIVQLKDLAGPDDRSPWKLTQFVFFGKEYGISGYLSKCGKLFHGSDGCLKPRELTWIPPDTLRITKNSKLPSRFSKLMYENKNQHYEPIQRCCCQSTTEPNDMIQKRLFGIVVYLVYGKYWLFYVSENGLNNFFKISATIELHIGTWLTLTFYGDNPKTHLLDSTNCSGWEEISDSPSFVFTRSIPYRLGLCYEFTLILTVRAKLDVYDICEKQRLALSCFALGIISDPDGLVPLNTFSQHIIIEVMPYKLGWFVLKYHGIWNKNSDLEKLEDPCIPYEVSSLSEWANISKNSTDVTVVGERDWQIQGGTQQKDNKYYSAETITSRQCLWSEDNGEIYDIKNEMPSGRDRISVSGVIIKNVRTHVLLYTPLPRVNKIVVKAEYLNSLSVEDRTCLTVGCWLFVHCEPRRVQPWDNEHSPSFSYIAIDTPQTMNYPTPGWNQRICYGVLEILLHCDLNAEGSVRREQISSSRFYVLKCHHNIEVLVPWKRLSNLLDSKLTAQKLIRLWATRKRSKCDIALQLIDSNPLEEVLPNGEVLPIRFNPQDNADGKDINEYVRASQLCHLSLVSVYPSVSSYPEFIEALNRLFRNVNIETEVICQDLYFLLQDIRLWLDY